MLDYRTATLLRFVNERCKEGKYEIVESDELLSCFPPKAGMDDENLKKTVNFLAEQGYLDIKYAEDGVYCLCPLPEGRLYAERVQSAKSDGKRRRRDMVLTTAIGAFVGAFVGSLVAVLIASLIRG